MSRRRVVVTGMGMLSPLVTMCQAAGRVFLLVAVASA